MKKLVVIVALLASAALTVMAQSAEEILDKSIQARGGAEKLNSLKSLRMEGTVSVMGMEIPTKSVIVHRRGMRNEMEAMGQSIIMAIDGEKGWMINPMAGPEPTPLPEEQLKASVSQLDLSGITNYKSSGTKTELLGKETLDGTEVYKVKMVSKDGMSMTHSIDTKNFNIIRTAIKVNVSGQDVEVETKMSNYKIFDGISFPTTTEITNPQAGVIMTTITKVEINPAIDESVFVMPKK
ncbi:outer membrane lipoprotein-sorting protein [Runella sp. CRIBMP]|uniref:LolA family protein n=1 Tax=Runella sp. CRIBMP TaxID=2683261 RepID=UPI0014127B04|nr:outer membrane lipoprotein-sorting protein [Runella sp. CRIBMP]NBB22794.1 outer membrane lipoprotein-sorting protein [Runella sp. CRIBMP]